MFHHIRADLAAHGGNWGAQGFWALVALCRVDEPFAPQIGNNVPIRANAVVLCDVPDDHVAYGVPAVVKPRKRGHEH